MKVNNRKLNNPVLYGAMILAVAVLAGTIAWTGYQASAQDSVTSDNENMAAENEKYNQIRQDLAAIAEKYKPRLDQNGDISRDDWAGMQSEIYDAMKKHGINPGVMIQNAKGTMDKGQDQSAGGNDQDGQFRNDLAVIAEKYKPRLDQNGNISRDDWVNMQEEIYDLMRRSDMNPGTMIQGAKGMINGGWDRSAAGNDQDGQFRNDLAAIAEKYKLRLDQNGDISRDNWVNMQGEIYDLMQRNDMNPGIMIQDIGWMDKKTMDESDASTMENESELEDSWAEY